MPRNPRLTLAVTAALALAPAAAWARDRFPGFVPNGNVHGCATCHVDPAGGGARNAFGRDVGASLAGSVPDWTALFDLDSDGDGQTNGQELGDPCGRWRPREAPDRTTGISLPGNAASLASNPEACGAGGAGGSGGAGGVAAGGSGGFDDEGEDLDDGERDDAGGAGGCASAGGGVGPWALLAAGWFLARRR
jgi:hypothetical protein